jgi:hypothetical protein
MNLCDNLGGNVRVSFRSILRFEMLDSATVANRMPSTRNAVTNSSRLHRRGIDGRSREARRFRDLFERFAESLGGESRLTEAERTLARTAASLAVKAEAMQAAVADGQDVDSEQLVRVSNSLARVLGKFGVRRDAAPTVRDRIAARYPAAKLSGSATP